MRTFLAVADAGSVTGGAARILRSQSAASVQIGQLETLLGRPVFERHGRGVALNSAGEQLKPIARQVIGILDAALADLRDAGLEGSLRIGIPDNHGRGAMSAILAEFMRDHPKVELTVSCALSTDFPQALARGDLDLAVHESDHLGARMELLREEKLYWVASDDHDLLSRDPIPLALFDRACWWRDVAFASIEGTGRPYRIAYSSESVTGIAAAIDAGLAIGVLSRSSLTDGLMVLPGDRGFGPLPTSKLVLEYGKSADGAVCLAMARAITRAFSQV